MPTPPGPSPSAEELESVTLKKQGTATRKASLGVVGPSFSGSFLQPPASAQVASSVLCTKLLQLCLTLCDPMDCSPQGSSVHGILQARMLEWVAISFSRGPS